MNTQTFELQAVTDEELMSAGGGIFQKLAAKGIGKAITKAMPKVTLSGAGSFAAQQGLWDGIEIAKENGYGEEE